MKNIFVAMVIMISITACTKHTGDYIEPTPAATLVISQPLYNQVLSSSDSIRVVGTAIADAVIHGYDVYITMLNDTARLQSFSVHDHNDTLLIDKKFSPQPKAGYEAHIILKLDHDGNTLHKFVSFKTE